MSASSSNGPKGVKIATKGIKGIKGIKIGTEGVKGKGNEVISATVYARTRK